MPSQEIENLASFLEKMVSNPEEDNTALLSGMSANLRAIAEQVTMLESLPLNLE